MDDLVIEIELHDAKGRRLAFTIRPCDTDVEDDDDSEEEDVVLDPYMQEHLILGPEPVYG